MSRTTVWIDGQRARLPGSIGAAGTTVPLSPAGEAAASLKALEALAPNPPRPGLHALRVVVGALFARYYMLPWQPRPRQDWVSGARMQAAQTGAGAEPRYAVTDGAWGRGRLAVAMSEALCAGMRLCKMRRLRLLGIEPGYTFALQKHAALIRDGAIATVGLEQADADAAIAHIGLRARRLGRVYRAAGVRRTRRRARRRAARRSRAMRRRSARATLRDRTRRCGPGDASRWVADAARVEWLPAPWDALA